MCKGVARRFLLRTCDECPLNNVPSWSLLTCCGEAGTPTTCPLPSAADTLLRVESPAEASIGSAQDMDTWRERGGGRNGLNNTPRQLVALIIAEQRSTHQMPVAFPEALAHKIAHRGSVH
jgi:hypothetical protein